MGCTTGITRTIGVNVGKTLDQEVSGGASKNRTCDLSIISAAL